MRRGITLVEMLVAMAITLLLMATVVQVFDLLGTAVANSRTSLEMNDRLRQARDLLQTDLSNISRPVTPWVTDHAGGYFEYIERVDYDANPTTYIGTDNSRFGDADDILMFTARSGEQPYQGLMPGPSNTPITIESPLAEIVWYCVETTTPAGETVRTICRRALLIAPWVDLTHTPTEIGNDLLRFQRAYDISARLDESGNIVPNSLADLALRTNRYRHDRINFPHVMDSSFPLRADIDLPIKSEHIILYNALAFDVRIFDRDAPILESVSHEVAFGPSDPGTTEPTQAAGTGAYVDLAYARYNPPPSPTEFSQLPNSVIPWPANTPPLFDTWSAFESDGSLLDRVRKSSNGIADTPAGLVDIGEHPYAPPYSATPAGIQVKLRAYEPDGRQIREVTVIQAFN